MDLEIFEEPEAPNAFTRLELYFSNRARWLKEWAAAPPRSLSLILLLLVSLEMVIARRLITGSGAGLDAVAQFVRTGLVIFGLGLLVGKIGLEVGRAGGHEGRLSTVLWLFGVGLSPLLLYLPLATLAWLVQRHDLRVIIFLLLCVKVLADWRLALESAYDLTRRQSGMAILFSFLAVYAVAVAVGAAAFLGTLANLSRLLS